MTNKNNTAERKLAITALDMAETAKSWDAVSLQKILKAARISKKTIGVDIIHKDDLIPFIFAYLENETHSLAQETEIGDTPKERLLELTLLQLDVMSKHRKAFKTIYNYLLKNKSVSAKLGLRYVHSLQSMLSLAKANTLPTPINMMALFAFAAIHSRAIHLCLEENNPSSPKAMAFLDRTLRQAEWVAKLFQSPTH